MTEEATSPTPTTAATPAAPRRRAKRTQGRRVGLHGGEHPGPRGPRGRPPPAGHVHRLDRRARPAPPRLGGRRQLDRRGDGRPRHHDRRSRSSADGTRHASRTTAAACRSGKHRPARTRSRSSTPCSTPAASSAAAATRCPAACTASASASSTRCPSGCASSRRATARSGPGVRARQAARAGQEARPAGTAATARRPSFQPDPEMFETIDFSFETIAQRLRESAYLNKGVWITLVDERRRPRAVVLLRGRPRSFVRHLNRNKEALHNRPIYVERREGTDRDRGRAPVQRQLHRERPRLRQQHQHASTAARTSPASGPR